MRLGILTQHSKSLTGLHVVYSIASQFFQATFGTTGRERKKDLTLCHMADFLLIMQNSAQVAHPPIQISSGFRLCSTLFFCTIFVTTAIN